VFKHQLDWFMFLRKLCVLLDSQINADLKCSVDEVVF